MMQERKYTPHIVLMQERESAHVIFVLMRERVYYGGKDIDAGKSLLRRKGISHSRVLSRHGRVSHGNYETGVS